MPRYSNDRLTVTIPIKKLILFQDDPCFKQSQGKGREMTVKDLIYGMKRLALPSLDSRGWWVLDEKVVGINAFREKLQKANKKDIPKIMEEEVTGLKALDDYTLQIKLTKPYPQLPYILAMSFTAPIASEAVAYHADERGNLTDHPVGTGPFMLTRWEHNHEVILDRNPNFRGELFPSQISPVFQKQGMNADVGKPMPFVDRLDIEIAKEAQPRWLNFIKGNADVVLLPKDNFAQAITNKVNLAPDLVDRGIHLSIETGVIIRYIAFNMKDSVLGSNKYLRQALSSAIDRDQWTAIFTNGTGKKMVNVIPPGIKDRPSVAQIKYDFNLERAKELLKKAGYPNGEGLPPLKFDLRGADSTNRQVGDFFQQQFGRIGVKLEVIPNTFPAFLDKLKRGDIQMCFGGWNMDYPDAENIYQLLYGANKAPGPNEANYDNPAFNKLYEKMAVMEPGPKRAVFLEQMEALLQEDCPWALGYYEASYDLSQPWFMNYRGSDLIPNKYKYYRVNMEIKKRYRERM